MEIIKLIYDMNKNFIDSYLPILAKLILTLIVIGQYKNQIQVY